MRLHDTLAGTLVLVLGVLVWLLARELPELAYFRYGPGFFPGLLGVLLALAGAGVTLRGLVTGRGAPLIARAGWTRSPARILDALAVIATVVAYGLLADRLGFVPTALVLLLLLAWRLWRRPLAALVLAVLATVVTQQAFVELLLVPLPWGVLEPWSGSLTWR